MEADRWRLKAATKPLTSPTTTAKAHGLRGVTPAATVVRAGAVRVADVVATVDGDAARGGKQAPTL